MTCTCEHCNEIKKQYERAEKRQADLFKARNSKLNIN
tara:strand:- start:96 stop:206 length:111 start_codon:yes stop_codon:yes gene_type:complete